MKDTTHQSTKTMTLRNRLEERIRKGKVEEFSAFPGFRERNQQSIREEVQTFKQEILQELKSILREAIGEDGAVALKGERGYTPQRGVDYLTSSEIQQIQNEIRPIKGRHYFDGREGRPGLNGMSPSRKEIENAISGVLSKTKVFSADKVAIEIARALEKLQGNARLDYFALKNLPGTPMYQTGRKKFTTRGGGDIINITDLSTSTDGSTKTFTIPFHNKAIMVVGSDFPSVLFQNNGFTVASSKLSITLTPENAPSTGSQLAFLYTL